MRSELLFDFETYHRARRALVEEGLQQFLSGGDPPRLWESMRYSVLSGGKRLRALLAIASAEAVASAHCLPGRSPEECLAEARMLAVPLACSIEMIHAMSLIHDDLPCMDDDDFRRGRPSNHKVFGEAIALLSGDALLIYAVEVLLKHSSELIDRTNLIKITTKLAQATGADGMVGGQVLDMAATGSADSLLESTDRQVASVLLSRIHKRKTGALISFSVWSGACLLGASSFVQDKLSEFGDLLGLSFQIADDLLDVSGDIETLGKTPGKDEAAGKLTWVSVYGIDNAREKLAELEGEGKELLASTGLPEAGLKPLYALLEYAIHRSH